MRKSLFILALLASAFTLPLIAQADTIDQFTFNFVTPPGYISVDRTVDLPASPPPSLYTSLICGTGCFVVVDGVIGFGSYAEIYRFSETTPGSTFVSFASYNESDGGLPIEMAYTHIIASEDLFTGSVSDPTFLTGTFNAEYLAFAGSPFFPGTITIEPIDTTAPEPSSLALLGTGILGLVAFTARRRVPR